MICLVVKRETEKDGEEYECDIFGSSPALFVWLFICCVDCVKCVSCVR